MRDSQPKWIRHAGVSICDQGLLSLPNYGANIFLARWLPVEAYGAFGLSFTIYLAAQAAHNALVLEPMVVYAGAADRSGIQSAALTLRAAQAHTLFALGAGGVFGLAASAAGADMAGSLLGMAVFAPAMLSLLFCRRVAYLWGEPQESAGAMVLFALVVGAGIPVLQFTGLLTALSASAVLAAGSVSAAVWIAARSGWKRRELAISARPKAGWKAVRKFWAYSRWSLGSTSVAWFTDTGYIPLVAMTCGLAAAGAMRAILTTLLPIGQLMAALFMVAFPHAAKNLAHWGPADIRGFALRLAGVAFAATGLYAALLNWQALAAMSLLYGKGRFESYLFMLPLLSLAVILRSTGELGFALPLRVMQAPALVFAAMLAGGAVKVAGSFALAGSIAVRGFGVAWVLGSMVEIGLLAVFLFGGIRRLRGER